MKRALYLAAALTAALITLSGVAVAAESFSNMSSMNKGDFSYTVVTDRTEYTSGDSLTVRVTANNNGSTTADVGAYLYDLPDSIEAGAVKRFDRYGRTGQGEVG